MANFFHWKPMVWGCPGCRPFSSTDFLGLQTFLQLHCSLLHCNGLLDEVASLAAENALKETSQLTYREISRLIKQKGYLTGYIMCFSTQSTWINADTLILHPATTCNADILTLCPPFDKVFGGPQTLGGQQPFTKVLPKVSNVQQFFK